MTMGTFRAPVPLRQFGEKSGVPFRDGDQPIAGVCSQLQTALDRIKPNILRLPTAPSALAESWRREERIQTDITYERASGGGFWCARASRWHGGTRLRVVVAAAGTSDLARAPRREKARLK